MEPSCRPAPGIGDFFFFAYTYGFQDAVETLNKPNFPVPDWARIHHDPAHPEQARYGAGDTPVLAFARDQLQALSDGRRGTQAQQRAQSAIDGANPADSLASQFNVGYLGGQAVWNGLVSIRDYSKPQYEMLLRDGVYLTQWPQTNVLAGLAAHATQDSALGRRQVRANALWRAFVWAYIPAIPHGTSAFSSFTFTRPVCTSKRAVTIHPRVPADFKITKIAVRINGKIATVKRRRLRAVRVSFAGRPAGTVSVVLRIRGTRGGRVHTIDDARAYRLCA